MSKCKITSPAELVASIPAILGFHPVDSLVALWTDTKAALVWSLRFALDSPEPVIADTLLELIDRDRDGQLMMVVYSSSLSCPGHVIDLQDRLTRNDVLLLDLILVADGRWRSAMCTSEDCCPPEGQLIEATVSELEVARVIQDGACVAGSRDELVARYELVPSEQPSAQLLTTVSSDGSPFERSELAIESLSRLCDGSSDDGIDLATVMVLVQDVQVRDLLLAHITEATSSEQLVEALANVAVRSPQPLLARMAGAAAAASAALGTSSVRTWCLLDLAGDDSLAELVGHAMRYNINPNQIRGLFAKAAKIMRGAETFTQQQVS